MPVQDSLSHWLNNKRSSSSAVTHEWASLYLAKIFTSSLLWIRFVMVGLLQVLADYEREKSQLILPKEPKAKCSTDFHQLR